MQNIRQFMLGETPIEWDEFLITRAEDSFNRHATRDLVTTGYHPDELMLPPIMFGSRKIDDFVAAAHSTNELFIKLFIGYILATK